MHKMGACFSVQRVHRCVGFHCPCRFPELYKQFLLLYVESVEAQREISSWYLVDGTVTFKEIGDTDRVTSEGGTRPVSYVDVHTHIHAAMLSHMLTTYPAQRTTFAACS